MSQRCRQHPSVPLAEPAHQPRFPLFHPRGEEQRAEDRHQREGEDQGAEHRERDREGQGFEHLALDPGEAEQVRQCLNQNGTLQVWMNPDTGRLANVCQVGPSLFGIQIIQKAKEGWDEITGFTKPKMKRLEQVMQYLRNTGYILLR